jgi:hypothetical protein
MSAIDAWIHGHWGFFTLVQSLIICLQRFRLALSKADIETAKTELIASTNILLASGAAMQLAGGFPKTAYEREVRNLMMPPNVHSQNFSGLMSEDHAYLMKLWKELKPLFSNLPPELELEHRYFVQAYQELATGHRAVCDKFGGGENKSLRSQYTALDELDKFREARLKSIDPQRQFVG